MVAVGYDQSFNPKIYRSTDALNWSPAASAGNDPLFDVIFDERVGSSRWLAVGDNAVVLNGSQTGFLWNVGTIEINGHPTGEGFVFNKIIRSGTSYPYRYTVCGNDNTGKAAIWYSSDLLFPLVSAGTYWQNTTVVSPISISNITRALIAVVTTTVAHNLSDGQRIVISGVVGMTEVNGNTYYVKASGYLVNTIALYSDEDLENPVDSRTFTAYTSGGTIAPQLPPLNSLATNGTKWVAVGDNGIIIDSSDGITWALQKSVTSERLIDIIFDATTNQFFIVGSDGYTAYSEDGTNLSWSYISGRTGNDLYGIVYGFTLPTVGFLISDITNASPAVVSTDQPHQLNLGDEVYISNVVGMTEINGQKFWVSPTSAYSVQLYADQALTVPFSTLTYSNYTSGGTIQILQHNYVAVGQNGTVLYSKTVEVYNPEAITDEYDEFNYDITLYDQNANLVLQWASPTLGELPPNLVFLNTGEIAGRVVFEPTSDQEGVFPDTTNYFYFYVQAYIVGQEEINETKQFYFTTFQKYTEPYETIYMQCYPTLYDRAKIYELTRPDLPLNPNTIIPSAAVYRINDPYFGRAKNIIYNHAYGIPASTVQKYLEATNKNHYWRDITLGPLQTAVARNSSGEIIYEVVYCQIVDDLVNNQGVSVSKDVVWNYPISLNLGPWYDSVTDISTSFIFATNGVTVQLISSPSTATYVVSDVEGLSLNMILGNTVAQPYITSITPETSTITLNTAISTPWVSGESVTFYTPSFYTAQTPGYARVVYPASLINMRTQEHEVLGYFNDDSILPAWMTSQQLDGSTLGYTPAWVIAYCNPGYSTTIKNNINAWQNSSAGIKFNNIQFSIDRFEVDKQLTFDWNGNQWVSYLPSSQPAVTNNSKDQYILFAQKTILPNEIQKG
jgi:hypothetical protein